MTNGDLAFDSEGDIYGSVPDGGDYGFGMVYELTRSAGGWTKTVLYNFLGGSDGQDPSSVIIDKSGNLYGTTSWGGIHGFGTVFELSPSGSGWSEKTLYDFKGSGDYDGYEPTSLAMDAAGNLYGATAYGENFGPSVFQLVPTDQGWIHNIIWRLVHLHLHGPQDRPAIDAAGNLYFTTTASCGRMRREDGSCDLPQHYEGEVFQLAPTSGGWKCTSLQLVYDPLNLSVDGKGNVYGTTQYDGDYGQGSIFKITP